MIRLANTWIAVNPQTNEVLDEFRSVDFDIADLFDRFGLPIVILDKTDGQRYLGSIVEEPFAGPTHAPTSFVPILRFAGWEGWRDDGELLKVEKS